MSSDTPRVALVTGGARGIGAAVAKRLAADGHAVAIFDRDGADFAGALKDIKAQGVAALAVTGDVSVKSDVDAAVAKIADELGPPVIVVNNAGITRDNLLFKMTEDDFDSVLAVHLRGTYLVSQATQAHMVKAGWGRIINLSSTAALGNRGQTNYSAVKAGLQGMTKTLAIELGPFGVTANAVAPGYIVTPMTDATAHRLKLSPEEYQDQVAERTPVRRVGQPEDIAHAISFFASEGAGFVTGQVLYVAGGPRA